MLQFLFGNLIWNLYLRFFVSKKLWGFDQNNGVIIVVRAREYERWSRAARNSYSLLSGQPIGRMPAHEFGAEYLLFTDRPEYSLWENHRADRCVAGTTAEFRQFYARHFVQHMPISIPTKEQSQSGGHTILGSLGSPDDFQKVLQHADRLIDGR